jgi:hypothetical protein
MLITLKQTLALYVSHLSYVSLLMIGNCNQNSKADGWLATAFTEPTLANGAAYVPAACVVTGTPSTYQNCLQVPNANIASGILVFSSCPL